MQKCHDVKYISTTDLASGYRQIPLHNQFCRISFGIRTAGSGLIGARNCSVGNQIKSCLTAYVDDLISTTDGNFEDHLNYIYTIFTVLQN